MGCASVCSSGHSLTDAGFVALYSTCDRGFRGNSFSDLAESLIKGFSAGIGADLLTVVKRLVQLAGK